MEGKKKSVSAMVRQDQHTAMQEQYAPDYGYADMIREALDVWIAVDNPQEIIDEQQ